MTALLLFKLFAKFALVCFGGGYMLVPLIVRDCVEKRSLITLEEFGNLVSVAQLTPGPVGINAATYLGYTTCGFAGSLGATLGLIVPSLICGSFAVWLLKKYQDHLVVTGLKKGTRLAAMGLIIYAVLIFMDMSVIQWRNSSWSFSLSGLIIAISSGIIIKKKLLPTTWVILLGGGAGALICLFQNQLNA